MKTSVITKFNKMAPCKEAVIWAKAQPNKQAAWDRCERGDWMLWLLGKLSGPPESKKRKKLVLCTCDCAATAIKYSGKHRKVIENTIKTARSWAHGKASIEMFAPPPPPSPPTVKSPPPPPPPPPTVPPTPPTPPQPPP